jgi:hypothetical protein
MVARSNEIIHSSNKGLLSSYYILGLFYAKVCGKKMSPHPYVAYILFIYLKNYYCAEGTL